MQRQTRSLLSAARQQQAGRHPTGYRYPAELRARLLEHVQRRRAEGATLSAVAAEVGVTTQTLGRWLQDGGGQPKLRRVVVARPNPEPLSPPSDCPILVTPTGYRVEGLTVDAVLRVLRSLS